MGQALVRAPRRLSVLQGRGPEQAQERQRSQDHEGRHDAGDAAGTSFTMTWDDGYPFRADEPADAEAWVAVISKRMAQTNP